MKRKIITTLLAVAMLAAETTTAHAANVGQGSALMDCAVTVNDWTTPAVFSSGRDWPITTWYFYDEDGQVLGSISGSAAMSITQRASFGNITWGTWLADAFNEYREDAGKLQSKNEITSEPKSVISEEKGSAPVTPILTRPQDDFDAEDFAMKVIELTNAERKSCGLAPLAIDEELMELAQIRAKEVSQKYSHERPDGTTVVTLGCGENVGARTTAEKQVNSWMNSEGHRRNILLDRYASIGAGCFKAENGRIYWVEVFFD